MNCPGCYKKDAAGFCSKCRKKLFNGIKIPPVLPFDTPQDSNLSSYQEKTKRLSISGVQLKYSLRIEEKELMLANGNGQYILKPIPPSAQLALLDQAPENEHLTMQIAEQVFGIVTAANAFMRFRDGAPAYITRRFDIDETGLKKQQEDFAQLSGRSKNTHGDNFKYDGTYEELAVLIKKYIAAAVPTLEIYFTLIVFNYLFSNGDAHLKNFSIVRTPYGDYGLTPAYDLMCTVLHTTVESDTALDLYQGDMDHPFYQRYGFYGLPHFEELAARLGLLPKRAAAIIDRLITRTEEVEKMILQSFLSTESKEKYLGYYLDKLKRFQIV